MAKNPDEMLKQLEKEIKKEYRQAAKEVEQKMNKHLDDFVRKDAAKRQKLAQGLITQKQYNDWRIGQVMMGKRWETMVKDLTATMNDADKVAAEMMYNHEKDCYAYGRNFGEYEIDIAIGAHLRDFTLYDRATVERLLVKNPKMLPNPTERVMKNVTAGRAQLWVKRDVQSVMLQSILQGESIPKVAKKMQSSLGESYFREEIKNRNKKTARQVSRELERKNRNAAIRNARTMTTAAQNGGRLDSYVQAQSIGIVMQKQWIAANDSRVRASHAAQDGEVVPVKEEFSNGLMFPADPDGDPREVYNCRCTMVAEVDVEETAKSNPDTVSITGLASMDFEEWENAI